ncbi:MAG: hypothetical protein BWK80_59665 [Desulfobacteraceae bacterium IS3]|nr:MAG: hypothetical protein BWK80_59665 [Desulfobacteraceae bacterium IS3]
MGNKLIDTLANIFNLRSGEGLATTLLFTHSVFIGIALTFLETASYSLFLTKFSGEFLPYAYMIAAGVTTFVGYVHTKAEDFLSFPRLLSTTLIVILVSLCALYLGLMMIDSKWTVLAICISYYVLTALFYLEFWGLTGRLFTLRQSKRLFSLIGAGETVGGIIAGFAGSVLVKFIGTGNLLVISVAAVLCCMVLLGYITRIFAGQIESPEEDDKEEEEDRSLSELLKSRYLRLVFCCASLSIFAYYFLDYLFYNQVESRFPNEDETAHFLGMFLGILRTLTLLCNGFLAGRLINRYGLTVGLLVFPTILAGGFFLAQLTYFKGAGVFFWMVVLIKVVDEVIRYTIEEPTIRILYQPLPTGWRLRAQTLVETMVEPVSGAGVGMLLLLITSWLPFKFDVIHLVYAMFVILGAWIFVAVSLRREYSNVLAKALREGKLVGGASIALQDASSKAVLHKGLRSQKSGDVIYCLNMLEEIGDTKLETYMIQLLEHPEPQVRRHAAKKIGMLGMNGALAAVSNLLEKEKIPDVVGAALQTLCALSEAESFEEVFSYIKNPELEIRKGAMIALLRHSGIDGVLAAGGNLNNLLDSEIPDERKLAAQVLGEVGISGFYRPLLKLLEDSDLQVRKAAIIASGNLKNPRLLPLLLKNFSEPAVRKDAVSAVVAFGESILPELEKAFDSEHHENSVRIRIIRALGRLRGERAVEILKKKMDFSEVEIRRHVLEALVSCRYRETDKGMITERIWKEVEDATWILSVLIDIGEDEDTSLLSRALKGEVEKNRKRIFLLMSMVYHPSEIRNAEINLGSSDAQKRSYALESLDTRVSQDIKGAVFPLLEDLSPAQRLSRLIRFRKEESSSRHERLKQILGRSREWISSWTKACALFTIGKISTMEFYDTVIRSLADPDPIVKETAIWALGCLNANDLSERLQPLTQDKSQRVAKYARFVVNSVGFASVPMGKGYLTRSGRYTADLFKNILLDEGERRARRCRAANILARFKGNAARNALMEALTIPDRSVRTAALDALVKGSFDIEGNIRDNISVLLHKESGDAQWILRSIVTFFPVRHSDRLIHALNQELNQSRKRMLSILTLLNQRKRELETLFYWYIHQENKTVPESVKKEFEALTSQLEDPNIRKMVIKLFKHRYFGRLSEVRGLEVYHEARNVERHLREIAFGSSIFSLSWSRICALDMIVKLNLSDCIPQLIEILEDADDIVRATAGWALFKLNPEIYKKYESRLINDMSPLVSKTAKQLKFETSQFSAG